MQPTNLFDLRGRVALVTGASRGLGRHFALTLACAGAKVALAARNLDALVEVARQIEQAGGEARSVHLDVTDAHSVRASVEAASALGPISILVNNAGIADQKPWDEQDEDAWDRVIDTNLRGVWLMAQATARAMVRQGGGGSIINIASILGLGGEHSVPAYCASKAAVVNLTRSLAMDLARHLSELVRG